MSAVPEITTEQIVARLHNWSHGAKEQGVDEVAEGLRLAADEIERLIAERDLARREVCRSRAACIQGAEAEEIAEALRWDCFKDQSRICSFCGIIANLDEKGSCRECDLERFADE